MSQASPSLPQRRFDIPHTDTPALLGIHLPLATRRRFGVTNESGVGRHSLRTAGAAVAHFLHMEGVTSSNHPRACGEHVKDRFVIDLGQSKRKDKLIHQLERYNDREWKIRRLFILDGEGFLEIKLK